MSIVQLSVSGSMLIAVVWLLQKLLLYRLPKWFFDLLWKAAALHLLLPLSISCRWSIWNVSSAFTAQLPTPTPENTVGSWTPVYTPPQGINTSATASVPILQLVWIGGMLLILCAALQCHLRHRLCLRRHNLPVSSTEYAVSPRYRISPVLGSLTPFKFRKKVVFPAPLAPRMAIFSCL